MNKFGICPQEVAWRNKCDPGKFLKEGKTNRNFEIDKLIYESQLKTIHYLDGYLMIDFNI